jgi:hypothetical protein
MLRCAVCSLMLLLAALSAEAQQPARKDDGTRQPRILLLVDASSSMLEPWGAKSTRFQTAGDIIVRLMDSIYAVNAGVEFGLRVYGHQSPAQNNDCYDSRQEVMFSKNNITQMSLRLASIQPFGVSPIAYSLKEAATNDLVDEARNAYSIILLTDGGESCGGNICDVVKQLIERKIYFKPYIISLVDYAPLREQYACLGAYLQAAKPADVPIAIHTIVDAYRPMLSAPIMAIKVDTPRKPAVQTINIPNWIPERSRVADLTISVPKTEMQVGPYRPILHPMALPRTAAVSKPAEEPVIVLPPRKQEALPGLRPSANQILILAGRPLYIPQKRFGAVLIPLPYIQPGQETLITISPVTRRNALPVAVVAAPVMKQRNAYIPVTLPFIAPEPQTIAALNPSSKPGVTMPNNAGPSNIAKRNPNIPVTLPNVPPDRRDTVKAVPPVATAPVPVAKTTIAIKKLERPAPPPVVKGTAHAPSNKPRETSFTKQTEDAKETSLAILFTDGRGKFYSTTPELQLLDAKTGKQVKKFFRTVDESGNPDPQVVPPGTYNLLVAGHTNMLMRGITVEANKKNKVIVKVGNGSLRFEYYDAPGRPVSEFEALVNIRFEPGPTIRQHCTAELEYPPGNYYIEVNTMPITRFNVDIDFGATSVVYVPEPGFVQFTNAAPKGRISLFAPLGDKFVRFTDVNITGNLAAQKLMLKPGVYEIHRIKNPNMPYASETIERFNVQSNSVTEIELN